MISKAKNKSGTESLILSQSGCSPVEEVDNGNSNTNKDSFMDEKDILIRLQDFDWSRQQKDDFIAIINAVRETASKDAAAKYDGEISQLKSQIQAANDTITQLNSKVTALEAAK